MVPRRQDLTAEPNERLFGQQPGSLSNPLHAPSCFDIIELSNTLHLELAQTQLRPRHVDFEKRAHFIKKWGKAGEEGRRAVVERKVSYYTEPSISRSGRYLSLCRRRRVTRADLVGPRRLCPDQSPADRAAAQASSRRSRLSCTSSETRRKELDVPECARFSRFVLFS